MVFLLTAGLLLPQLAADIDYFFLREPDKLTLAPAAGWAVVLSGGRPLYFYLLLAALLLLGLAWILFTGTYLNYRSGMWEVTPDIVTPCADGQGQFGTARWLPENKRDRYFGVLCIKDVELRTLQEAGQADFMEVERYAQGQIERRPGTGLVKE